MIAVIDAMGKIGAYLAMAALLIAMFVATYASYNFFAGPGWKRVQGGIAALVAFLLAGAFFYPSVEALNRLSCEGEREYQQCVDHDY